MSMDIHFKLATQTPHHFQGPVDIINQESVLRGHIICIHRISIFLIFGTNDKVVEKPEIIMVSKWRIILAVGLMENSLRNLPIQWLFEILILTRPKNQSLMLSDTLQRNCSSKILASVLSSIFWLKSAFEQRVRKPFWTLDLQKIARLDIHGVLLLSRGQV